MGCVFKTRRAAMWTRRGAAGWCNCRASPAARASARHGRKAPQARAPEAEGVGHQAGHLLGAHHRGLHLHVRQALRGGRRGVAGAARRGAGAFGRPAVVQGRSPLRACHMAPPASSARLPLLLEPAPPAHLLGLRRVGRRVQHSRAESDQIPNIHRAPELDLVHRHCAEGARVNRRLVMGRRGWGPAGNRRPWRNTRRRRRRG